MIRLIVAHDLKRGIAKHGIQPWSIPKDEAYFSTQTKLHGGRIVMGSKTFKTVQVALADRMNYVVSSQKFIATDVQVVTNFKNFLGEYTFPGEDIWVIGGEKIYQQVISWDVADELYITLINADFGCDQYFPDYTKYQLNYEGRQLKQNGFSFKYLVYAKNR